MKQTNDNYINEESNKSQCSKILGVLINGGAITPIETLNLCGCFRLAARIHDLRHKKGYDNIVTERVLTSNGKYVAQYRLAL